MRRVEPTRGSAMFAEQASERTSRRWMHYGGTVLYATSERLRINHLASSLPPPLPSVLTARGEQWRSGSSHRAVKRAQSGRVYLSRTHNHVEL
jgi:hypothetical protein